MSTPTRYSGLFPVAPTAFHADGSLDLEGQRRVLDCMIDQGVDGICILANYSEQFLVSDEERAVLTRLCLEHVAGRIPIIVTCSHFSTEIAALRGAEAAKLGASLLMITPPYHGMNTQLVKIGDQQIYEHFAAVADAARIPIMIQDAPLSGVNLSVDLLVRIAREIPLVSYFKIEIPGTAAKLRQLIEKGGDAIVGPFDGEEAITLMADLDAGATGCMTSAMAPDLIAPILRDYWVGDRAGAMLGYQNVLSLINFENRQCGLRAAKTVMVEGGVIASDHVRHPLEQIHPATKAELLELARQVNPIALYWGR